MTEQPPATTQPPIGNYAIIGDCLSAALVSEDGSIDWLCLPYFHSPSVFGALLDWRRGGRFRIRPRGRYRARRRYLDGTNVLETVFETPTGVVRLRDAMPMDGPATEGDSRVVREVEGTEGEVELALLYEPRPDYGRWRGKLRDEGWLGLRCEHRGRLLALFSDIPLEVAEGGTRAVGFDHLRQGDRRLLSLSFADRAPMVLPGQQTLRSSVSATADWWRRWIERADYRGPYRGAVRRSALTLKLLTFAPSGAVVAAPTTSLPEVPGGARNWDYRYCWPRDATLTVETLLRLGYHAEAQAFVSWLLHTTRISYPRLRTLYDVFGETGLRERRLEHWSGYRGARPVRVGNDAVRQLQLDTYGEVIDAVYRYVRHGGSLDRPERGLLRGLGKTVCARWREPDQGIWEPRGPRHHHTHSKVLCWVALDRLIRLHDEGVLRMPRAKLAAEQRAIRADIEEHGHGAEDQSYTATYGERDMDGALLLLSRYGFVEGDDARMRATIARVREHLSRGATAFRFRERDDSAIANEGAFGAVSFWQVSALARAGEVDEAQRLFERLLQCATPLGLYAEEIDPETGEARGNFPQAFTHVALIDAAYSLELAPRKARAA